MTEGLQQLALEIAASSGGNPSALAYQIGRLRFLSGFLYGKAGVDLATAELATEELVGRVIDEAEGMREARAQ